MLENIILGILMEGNQNGYKIKQHMALGTSNFLDASYGSLYPALKRLTKKGFIQAEEAMENGRYTKVYSITNSGKESFMKWLKIPAEISSKPHDHVTKLYFYDYLDEKTKKEHYKYYIKSAEAEKQILIDIIPAALEVAGPDRQQTMEYGIRYYDNMIAFYNKLIEKDFDISRHQS
jgi:DNA-binding PadR family transcriptional regulator